MACLEVRGGETGSGGGMDFLAFNGVEVTEMSTRGGCDVEVCEGELTGSRTDEVALGITVCDGAAALGNMVCEGKLGKKGKVVANRPLNMAFRGSPIFWMV